LRKALLDYLDSDTPANEFRVKQDGDEKNLDWIIGKLWDCTDVLPGSVQDLDHEIVKSRERRLIPTLTFVADWNTAKGILSSSPEATENLRLWETQREPGYHLVVVIASGGVSSIPVVTRIVDSLEDLQ
jgi:hypothetical protein